MRSDQDKETPGVPGHGIDWASMALDIKRWGRELGFAGIGISGIDVSAATPGLQRWLELGYHGGMDYMAKHAGLRSRPADLVPQTISVITARLPYWPEAIDCKQVLANPGLGYIARYALGRDYHKTVRQRLQKLSDRISSELRNTLPRPTNMSSRVFTDSAPVLEVELARLSGIAWRGKHTVSLTRDGSWHFLGEIYTNLPLPADTPITGHCGTCTRCITACPTGAIVAPYLVDARRCISYLTIECHGPIPLELRPLIGNRIYGCDDCQIACPWNSFAQTGDPDFAVRHGLDARPLHELLLWSAEEFNHRMAGSPVRRIGHERWQRNLAVAMGNASAGTAAISALQACREGATEMVREHIDWALNRFGASLRATPTAGIGHKEKHRSLR